MVSFMETDEVSTLSGPVRVFEVCPLSSGEASADNGWVLSDNGIVRFGQFGACLERVLGPCFGPVCSWVR